MLGVVKAVTRRRRGGGDGQAAESAADTWNAICHSGGAFPSALAIPLNGSLLHLHG